MVKRVVVALLVPVLWHPPGVDARAWRTALAEDVVDLLARLAQAEPAIAATPDDRALAEEIAWPGMRIYEVPTATVLPVLAAAAADGFDQAAVIAADAADVPGMVLGKLLRPLDRKPVAVAPAGPSAEPTTPSGPGERGAGASAKATANGPGERGGGASAKATPNGPGERGSGALGVATTLPAPEWLVDHDLDTVTPMLLRGTAPRPGDVESTPEWRRLRGPADLATLDPALEGWENTRALLGG